MKLEHKPYLIVGSGRLAKHFCHYFSLLKIPFHNWFRNSGNSFNQFYNYSGKVILLINDDSIEEFISEFYNSNPSDNKTWIHCSGALSTNLAYGAHPLSTFGEGLYSLELYQSIPFILEEGTEMKLLFPELSNPVHFISPEDKIKYHAWCSIAGNFTSILWSEFFHSLEKMNLPREVAFNYLEQTFNNLLTQSNPVTGPVVRGDDKVIEKHLNELDDEPVRRIYEAFTESFPEFEISKRIKR